MLRQFKHKKKYDYKETRHMATSDEQKTIRKKILAYMAGQYAIDQPISWDSMYEAVKLVLDRPLNTEEKRKYNEIGRRYALILYKAVEEGMGRVKGQPAMTKEERKEHLARLREQRRQGAVLGAILKPIPAAKRLAPRGKLTPTGEAWTKDTCKTHYSTIENKKGSGRFLFDESRTANQGWLGCSKVRRECCEANIVPGCKWEGQGKGCQRIKGAEALGLKPKPLYAFDTDAFEQGKEGAFGEDGACSKFAKIAKATGMQTCSHLPRQCCNTTGTCKYQQGRGCRIIDQDEEIKIKRLVFNAVPAIVRKFQDRGYNPEEIPFRDVFAQLENAVKTDLDYQPMFEYVIQRLRSSGVPYQREDAIAAQPVEEKLQRIVDTADRVIQHAARKAVLAANIQGRAIDPNAKIDPNLVDRVLGQVRNRLFDRLSKLEKVRFREKFLPAIQAAIKSAAAEGIGENAAAAFEIVGENVERVRYVVQTAIDKLRVRFAESTVMKDNLNAAKDVYNETVAEHRGKMSAPFKKVLKKALHALVVRRHQKGESFPWDDVETLLVNFLTQHHFLTETIEGLVDKVHNQVDNYYKDRIVPRGKYEKRVLGLLKKELAGNFEDEPNWEKEVFEPLQAQIRALSLPTASARFRDETGLYVQKQREAAAKAANKREIARLEAMRRAVEDEEAEAEAAAEEAEQPRVTSAMRRAVPSPVVSAAEPALEIRQLEQRTAQIRQLAQEAGVPFDKMDALLSLAEKNGTTQRLVSAIEKGGKKWREVIEGEKQEEENRLYRVGGLSPIASEEEF